MELHALRNWRQRAGETRRRAPARRSAEPPRDGEAPVAGPSEGPAAPSRGANGVRTEVRPRGRPMDASDRPVGSWSRLLKSAEDRTLAAGLLLFTGPLILLIGALIKLESPGPVFVACREPGLTGAPVRLLKFRCDSAGGPGAIGGPRLTGLGAFLRASGLENLPQLLGVLSGHKSIVGVDRALLSPWPETWPMAQAVIACASRRGVKPGLTSLSRVRERRRPDRPRDRLEQVAKDEFDYLQNWSIWLDGYIMLKTIRLILTGQWRHG